MDKAGLYMAALESGIVDQSYNTVRHGRVTSYSGRAEFTHKGQRWLAIGHKAKGYGPEFKPKDGRLELHQQS